MRGVGARGPAPGSQDTDAQCGGTALSPPDGVRIQSLFRCQSITDAHLREQKTRPGRFLFELVA